MIYSFDDLDFLPSSYTPRTCFVILSSFFFLNDASVLRGSVTVASTVLCTRVTDAHVPHTRGTRDLRASRSIFFEKIFFFLVRPTKGPDEDLIPYVGTCNA